MYPHYFHRLSIKTSSVQNAKVGILFLIKKNDKNPSVLLTLNSFILNPFRPLLHCIYQLSQVKCVKYYSPAYG